MIALVFFACCMLLAPRARAAIAVRITSPSANAIVGDITTISVTTTSDFDVTSVRAAIGAAVADLTPGSCTGCWQGYVRVDALPSGPKTLTITATDIVGGTQVATESVILDRPPKLDVVSPILNVTVARPDLRIRVTCTDDGSAGCLSLKATYTGAGENEYTLATGGSSIDTTVSFPPEALDRALVVTISALDDRGQLGFARGTIIVETSAALALRAEVPGGILDVDATRILYVAVPSGIMTIRDRASGVDTPLTPFAYPFVGPYDCAGARAVLTQTGAFWSASGPVEVRNGVITQGLQGGDVLDLSPRWAVYWSGATSLAVRDLDSGTVARTIDVSARMPEVASVAPNGDVYWYTYAIQGGGIVGNVAGVTADVGQGRAPIADGVNVVFNAPFANDAIQLLTSGAVQTLASGITPSGSVADALYTAYGGWTAFPKKSSAYQIWRRAPDGTQSQASVWSQDSTTDVGGCRNAWKMTRRRVPITSAGDMMLLRTNGDAQERWLSKNGVLAPTYVNRGRPGNVFGGTQTLFGMSIFIDPTWYVYEGGSLFEVVGCASPTGCVVSGGGADAGAGADASTGTEAGADAGGPPDASTPGGDAGIDATVPEPPDAQARADASIADASSADASGVDASSADDGASPEPPSDASLTDSGGPSTGDASTGGADARAPDAALSDAGSTESPPSDDGGCAVGAPHGASCGNGVFAAGLAALAFGRRRRRGTGFPR